MAFEGEVTSALKGRGRDGFIRTVNNLTVLGDLVVHGETRSEIGTGSAFWEDADANANYWAYDLPTGGDINVPVVGFGIGLADVDLGLFNGVTQTTVAVIDADRDSFLALDFSGDDASRIRSNTTIGIVPTGALSVGTDGSGNDVIFYSGTAGDNLTWDASEEVLQITGTNGQTSLDVLDGDVRIVDTLYFFDRGGESISSDGSTLTVAGTVVFSGSITVQGTTTSVESNTVVIDDPLFHLGNDNNADTVDLGIFAEYTDSGKKFSGLFRDASDSDKWKLFATTGNSHEEPSTTVNTTSGFTLANLAVNELDGTLTTAAQPNVTSFGTLSTLTVDQINLNGGTVTVTDSSDTGDLMTLAVTTHGATTLTTTDDDASAADFTIDADGEVVIDPADAAGTIFKLNGSAQVSIIDGVIKPASTNDIDLGTADVEFKNAYFDGTVTSDAFAGPLTGNADTATALATGRTIAMTGDVAWTSASFDGSGNVTGSSTIQSGAVETAMLNDNVISGQTELAATGLASEDEILISDGGTIKRYGVDSLIQDAPALLTDTTIANGDYIVFLDGGSTGTAKKEALADLVGVMAGTVTSTGLSDSSSVLTVDIQNLNATTTVADGDLVMIDDGAGGALRKMTRANFIESAALDAINIDGGAIDAVTLGTNSAITEAVIDDINLNGKVITMTGSSSDTAVFTVGTNGTLTIETTDAAAAAANLQITADGTVDIDSAGALTLDSGGAINLEPASGSAIVLDGTINVDAGVVTGATSITSTNFVGALTGNASGTAATVTGAAQSNITSLGTLTTLTVDNVIINATNIGHTSDTDLLTLADGALTLKGTLTVGVDDTGHDVKFFGASAGAYMEWDESEDQLRIMGASADATTSTGKLLLATSLTDINANDVLGKIDFQAPHEAGGTDAITVAASIQAIAQGTFSASVNATDLIFYTGHSEAATEKFRFTSQGELGIGGANYGTDGQVLTSTGAGTAPAWEDAGGGAVSAVANGSDNRVVTFSSSDALNGEANLTFDGSTFAVTGDATISDDLGLVSDAAVLTFGGNSEITLTHVHDVGLNLKHTATGDDKPIVLTLQTGETDIAADDVIGKIAFQAPDEAQGTDAILVAAAIQAVSEGDFSSSNNATKLSFMTGASEAAAEKVSISSAGHLSLTASNTELRFYEGANYVGFEAPALSGDQIWVLPNADGSSNQALVTDGSGTLSWASVGSGTGAHDMWIPAAAMRPTTTNGCSDLITAELSALQPEVQYLGFATGADDHAQFSIAFPKSWNEGTVTYRVYWSSTATDTDGVTWGLMATSMSDNVAMGASFGTAVLVDDAAQSAANELYVSPTSSALTIGGSPAEGDLCFFDIYRDVSDGNDTMGEDARLMGIVLTYTTNAATDA